MAEGSGMPNMLDLRRSLQSGGKAMAAAWTTVYSESSSFPFLFGGAIINLSLMQAGDTISVRLRKTLSSGGTPVVEDLVTYNDAQPAAHQAITIPAQPNVYGIDIAMQQTAGPLKTIECEFYDAKLIGSD